MIEYIPLLIQGTLTTVQLWLISSCISLLYAVIFGIVSAKKLRVRGLSFLADVVGMILRGVPLYAQLMISYFVIPHLTGISLSPFATGVLTLGICSGAYASELIRGALNAVPDGQWAASQVLGYSSYQQLRYIIIPQATRIALPGLINEYTMALKSTSLLASIGTLELTKIGTNIMHRSLDPVGVCLALAAIYLILTALVSLPAKWYERSTYAQR